MTPSHLALACCFALLQWLLLFGPSDAFRLASLSSHEPGTWARGACVTSMVECNLQVYREAISEAERLNADLMLFPEAYALSDINGEFEPFVSKVGTNPCDQPAAVAALASAPPSPQQSAVSCAAAQHNITVVANFFVKLDNGTKRITDVVFNSTGGVIAQYSKHHLVPIAETAFASAGPFAPTVVKLPSSSLSFGLAICYEGVYPELTGDWSQFDAFRAQGADMVLWSIGGMVNAQRVGESMAKRLDMAVTAAEDGTASVFLNASGKTITPAGSSSLATRLGANYTGKASVVVAELDPNL